MLNKALDALFKFKIGDQVWFASAVVDMVDGLRPTTFTIVERVVLQCSGGVQKFYALNEYRSDSGAVRMVAELALEPVDYEAYWKAEAQVKAKE